MSCAKPTNFHYYISHVFTPAATFDALYFSNFGMGDLNGRKVLSTKGQCCYSAVYNLIKGISDAVRFFSDFSFRRTHHIIWCMAFQGWRHAMWRLLSKKSPSTLLELMKDVFFSVKDHPLSDNAHSKSFSLVYQL